MSPAAPGPARLRGDGRALATCALAHAAMDATSVGVLFSSLQGAGPALVLQAVVLYNVAAFAPQPLIGVALDRRARPEIAGAIGGAVTAACVALLALGAAPMVLALVAGLGNAFLHVGCGIRILRASPGRAGAAGLFVAPGAAGLAIGVAMGRAGGPVWIAAAILLGLCAAVALLPPLPQQPPVLRPAPSASWVQWAVGALLVVVAVRAFVGTALVFPWKSAPVLLVTLTAATVVGKAAGGLLADRFGRARVGVGALVVSIPFLVFGVGSAAAGLVGVLLFNMTMPITLVAIVDAVPGQPGFGFGLTCLALVAGGFPLYLGFGAGLAAAAPLTLILLGTAALLAWALRPPRATFRIATTDDGVTERT